MTARFILSLDCEGKWGVADLLNADLHRTLSDERLRSAYGALVDMLDEFEIPATFAFVGAFTETPSGLKRLQPQLAQMAKRVPHYVGAALSDMNQGSRQGWCGDWAVDRVGAARTTHEIALHGVSHVPWTWMDQDLLSLELALLRSLESPVRTAKTFIYPRNEVAHVEALASIGIEGYRLAPPPRSRAVSLLSELNVFAGADRDSPAAGAPRRIPAGRFINLRSGPRRLVPTQVSSLRGARMLQDSEQRGGVVHYWAHPENFASAPSTLHLLHKILERVARLRDAGRCEVLTQIGYCRSNRTAPPQAGG
ncbi:MAG: hypothetical protein WKF52_00325 [Sphingomicrobium sp.]